MNSWDFYFKHLSKVSRSFSFCIAQLDSPAREWVGLAYLLFRVADTIEDSSWQTFEMQSKHFDVYNKALSSISSPADELPYWYKYFPPSTPKDEVALIKDITILLSKLNQTPPAIKNHILKTLTQMIEGMHYFRMHHTKNGVLQLKHTPQLNQYCFFVAGIIGELLSNIFDYTLNEWQPSQRSYIDAFHFGLFLQKINILKDQMVDEASGRRFIPDRQKLRASIGLHAKHAFDYIIRLPRVSAIKYRLFCAWSLFIGLASLKWIDKSYKEGDFHKISFAETMSIVNKVKKNIHCNESMQTIFNNYTKSDIYLCENNSNNQLNLPDWFCDIYTDSKMLEPYLSELGLA